MIITKTLSPILRSDFAQPLFCEIFHEFNIFANISTSNKPLNPRPHALYGVEFRVISEIKIVNKQLLHHKKGFHEFGMLAVGNARK